MTEPFLPRVRALASASPFTGPETLERQRGGAFAARLGANENGFGPSPRAIEAMAEAARQSWMYGDPEQFALRTAIAERLGLDVPNVICGSGIDGLLRDLVVATCEPGDTVLTSRGAYPTFGYFAAASGAKVETIPFRPDFRQDWSALAERAADLRPRILYLTNPDNPTGTWRDTADLGALLAKVPEETIVALDEAYCEFAPADALAKTALTVPNLLRFRTFSKAFGMAGIRVGYVFGEGRAIAQFHKVRDHFVVSRIAQEGARVAWIDREYLSSIVAKVAAARVRLSGIACANGLAALPSATNFVAMDLADPERCAQMVQALSERAVFVRRPGAPGLDRLLRVSVGPKCAIDRFEAAFADALSVRSSGRPAQ